MNDIVWIRELSPLEASHAREARTGDVLSDGSVLLWRDDMNRMGLDTLRTWIMQKVLEERVTIAVGSPSEAARENLRDELVS